MSAYRFSGAGALVEIDGEPVAPKFTLLRVAVCCREWPVYSFARWGRCGFCGERPVLSYTRTIADYMRDREVPRHAETFPV